MVNKMQTTLEDIRAVNYGLDVCIVVSGGNDEEISRI